MKARGIAAIWAAGMMSLVGVAQAQPVDHIGPDPIQSQHCLIITPAHSVVCRGRQTAPDPHFVPTFTVSCGPGVLLLISHKDVADAASARILTLRFGAQELRAEWLAVSAAQSALLSFYSGPDSNVHWGLLDLLGSLMTADPGSFEFEVASDGQAGEFVLDYSDRKLIEQMAMNCA